MTAVAAATTVVDATHQKNKRTRGRGRPRKEVTQNNGLPSRPLPSPPILPVSRRSSRRPRQQLREDFYNVDGIVVEDEEDEYVGRGQETDEMEEEVMTVEEEEEEEEDCKSKKKLKLLLKLNQNPQTKLKTRSRRVPDSCSSDEEASRRDRCNDEDNDEIRHHEDVSRRLGSSHMSSTSGSWTGTTLPDLKTLALILDNIQKKDKYGVFSEPVDPEELPDYHEVIEHPMDFGTIRKKLASSIYSDLEEFEGDVLLVCSNAMQYNSPETIYFKQARSMQELAKKKFQAIRARSNSPDVILNNVQGIRLSTAGMPMKDQPSSFSDKCIENQEKLVFNGHNKDQPKSPPNNLIESQSNSLADNILEDSPKPVVDNLIENPANSVSDKSIEKSMCRSPKPQAASADSLENKFISNGNVSSETKTTEYIGSEKPENCSASMASSVHHQGLSEKAEPLEKSHPSGYGQKSTSLDEDRRATYTNSKNEPTLQSNALFATFESEKKLVAVGLHDESSYARSLARFSATLGPIAWRIASKYIEKSLPSGLKFGPGWVGEFEPPLAPIFSCENNVQQVSSSSQRAYHKVASESKYNCEDKKAKVDNILQNKHAALTNGSCTTEVNCKPSAVVEGEIFGKNTAEGTHALFGFPLGHQPRIVSETLQHQRRGTFADYSAKIYTSDQDKTDVSTCAKSVTNHVDSPIAMHQGYSDVGASRCMDMGFKNSSNIMSDGKSENSIPEVKKSSTFADDFPALQDGKNSINQRLNGSVGFFPCNQSKSNPLALTNKKVDDHAKLSRMLPGNVLKYPNSLLPNTSKQLISPVLSAGNQSIAVSTSIAPTWIPARISAEHESARINMDAHKLMPATNSAEHASPRTSDAPKRQTKAPTSKPTWMFPHSTSGFQEVNNGQPLPQLSSRPTQEVFRDQGFQNKSAVTFPNFLSDLPKFHCQSPWRGFVQHAQHSQRHNVLPPDLNVGFQPPGSPGKQSSSILIESQQPDLALQL